MGDNSMIDAANGLPFDTTSSLPVTGILVVRVR